MKTVAFLILLAFSALGYSQSLPIDFEGTISTDDFSDFDGGRATVIPNPQVSGINTSATVAQIVRDGGAIWAGSKIQLADFLDFNAYNAITMKVYTSAPVGTVVKFKLEGNANTERDVTTTVSNEWETLTWDFTGEPMEYTDLVFMFDFGNTGDGSENSTFLFDDVEQLFGGTQLDLPVTFEEDGVNYTTTDFGGNTSSLVPDPEDATNTVAQVIKTDGAATWSGTTIGTPAGFATAIPLSLEESIMTARVWSPESGTPIRLKVEDSRDPTHTCETETNTTVGGEWEVIEFDFLNQAPGTELLSIGVERGWRFNMASIFMNFGTEGATAGEKTYYFDELRFGDQVLSLDNTAEQSDFLVYPNPADNYWIISNLNEKIEEIALYTINGELLQNYYPNASQFQIPNSNLTIGSYIAKVSQGNKVDFLRLTKG